MNKLVVTFFCAVALAVHIEKSEAISDAHKLAIHEHMIGMAMECMKTNVLTEEEINMMKTQKQIADSENARCFVACVFKKAGIMNEDGKMSFEGGMATAEKAFSDAPEQIENMREFLNMCNDVNDKPVSDGSAGCDRAQLAFTCLNEHASKFGLEI